MTSVPAPMVEHPIMFAPHLAAADAAKARGAVIGRLISLVISVAITGALWWFLRDQLAGGWWLWVLGLAPTLILLAISLVRWWLVRRVAASVPAGMALGLGRDGVQLADRFVAWGEVASVAAVQRRVSDAADLVLTGADGVQARWPLRYLQGTPAGIDSAIRAFSDGRQRVDFSRFDA